MAKTRGFGGSGSSSGGAFDLGGLTGLELSPATKVAMSMGIDDTDWFTEDTRVGSERNLAHKPLYVEGGDSKLNLRVGGLLFTFDGTSDAILGSNEAAQNFVLSAVTIGRVIPPNLLEVGDRIFFDAWGRYPVVAATPNLVLGFRLDATTLVAVPAISPSGANHVWRFRGEFGFTAVGALGSGLGFGTLTQGQINSSGSASSQMAQSGSAGSPAQSVATNGSLQPAIFVDRAGGADDTNSIVMHGLRVSIVKNYLAAAA